MTKETSPHKGEAFRAATEEPEWTHDNRSFLKRSW
jgi:hypothetical protein